MFRKSIFLVLALILTVSYFSADEAATIPAFARKYAFSCDTCHLITPKLKAYGEDFAGNAFQLPDEDEPVRAYRDVGDDNLLLQRDLPIGVRFDAYTRASSDGDISNDLETPFGVKLLSGGLIAKDIGYYFYFYMDERGEVAGLEDAYVHFNNIGGSQLDIMVGQFQISDPLFKRELRLTFEDYMIYKTKVGDCRANLTYDRGILATYTLPTNTDIIVELVNGNGIEDAGKDRVFDNDSLKNVFVKLSQPLSIATFGVFAYTGKEEGITADNKFLFAGPDVSIGIDKLEINAQYVMRTDDNPEFKAGKTDDIETSGIIGEIVINPHPEKSRLFGTILYNSVTSDMPGLEYESITASVNYLYRTNLRLLAEFTQDIEYENSIFTLGFMAGF